MRIALVICMLATLSSSARAANPPTLADVGWLAREGSWTIEGTVMMEIRGEWHTLIRGQWVLEHQATAPLPVN
jgi:hypothetical protein